MIRYTEHIMMYHFKFHLFAFSPFVLPFGFWFLVFGFSFLDRTSPRLHTPHSVYALLVFHTMPCHAIVLCTVLYCSFYATNINIVICVSTSTCTRICLYLSFKKIDFDLEYSGIFNPFNPFNRIVSIGGHHDFFFFFFILDFSRVRVRV